MKGLDASLASNVTNQCKSTKHTSKKSCSNYERVYKQYILKMFSASSLAADHGFQVVVSYSAVLCSSLTFANVTPLLSIRLFVAPVLQPRRVFGKLLLNFAVTTLPVICF